MTPPAAPKSPTDSQDSFRGRLEDLSVAELLQVIHYGSVSGKLQIEDGQGARATLLFGEGKLVAATSPTPGETMGEILVTRGTISREQLAAALTEQRESSHRYLGEVLLAKGFVTQADIEAAILEHFKRVIATVQTWTGGSFEVTRDFEAPRDRLAWFPDPSSIAQFGDLPSLLLEVAAALEEDRDRSDEPTDSFVPALTASANEAPFETPREAETPRPVLSVPGAQPRDADEVVILTARSELLDVVGGALEPSTMMRHAECVLPLPRSVLELHRHHCAAVLIVDGATPELKATLEAIREAAPLVPLVVTLPDSPPVPVEELWALGARVLRSRELTDHESLRAMVGGCMREARDIEQRMRWGEQEMKTMLDGLHALRSGADRATILSTVLRLFTKQMRRVILFARRGDRLVAVASRGHDADVSNAIGIPVSLSDAAWRSRVIDEARPWADCVVSDPALEPIFSVIGPPAMDEGLLIPIRSLDRVVAILYGDNGALVAPIGAVFSLEILALQAGLLFETIALHRQGSGSSATSD